MTVLAPVRPAIGSVGVEEKYDRPHRKRIRRRLLFTIRLTDLEAEILERAATRAGLTPSQLARARLFASDVADDRIAKLEDRLDRLERDVREDR